jgi:signal transduction histidine kinase
MMHTFLENNRDELIARCKAKVAQRPRRDATAEQLKNGVPMFLEQLRRTLEAEEVHEPEESFKISGGAGGATASTYEMGVSAAAHGKKLLELGFTVDQVVHDYGDLCQAITDLAVERDAPFEVDEFRTLNRCLDNAIADAVAEFSAVRDAAMASRQAAEVNERVGFLVHELRNSIGTAKLAVGALELGSLPMSGATGSVLKRSLEAVSALIDHSVAEVRLARPHPQGLSSFQVDAFIADAAIAASLEADARKCALKVLPVDPALRVSGDRDRLLAALANLLQNAFKFTHLNTEVTLGAYAAGERLLIEVEDKCGGLQPRKVENMFTPFTRRNDDRSGLGLGLAIARQSVEAAGGILSVRNLPGSGCLFTINLRLVEQP